MRLIDRTIKKWTEGKESRPTDKYSSFWTDGTNLFSYYTCIVCWCDGVAIVNRTKYSITTTKKQNYIFRLLKDMDAQMFAVDHTKINMHADILRYQYLLTQRIMTCQNPAHSV